MLPHELSDQQQIESNAVARPGRPAQCYGQQYWIQLLISIWGHHSNGLFLTNKYWSKFEGLVPALVKLACQHSGSWYKPAHSIVQSNPLLKRACPVVICILTATAFMVSPLMTGCYDPAAEMIVPGFGPAAMVASGWAESFARQMGNNTLPAAATLVTLRLASEQLGIEAGLRDFMGNRELIQKLDKCAIDSQQASDKLVTMLTGAEGTINRMTSYTAFLELSLDANQVHGKVYSAMLANKFENYLDQLDDEFDTVIFKAEDAYKSIEVLQQSLLTSSAITGLSQKQETVPEKAWYSLYTPQASPKLLDNLSYLNGTAAFLHTSRVEVASVRLNLLAFREKLHQLKAGALAGHDDLPLDVQRPFLRNALESLMRTQGQVQGYTQLPAQAAITVHAAVTVHAALTVQS